MDATVDDPLVRVVHCRTERQLLDGLLPRSSYFKRAGDYSVLFRGHADERFQLLPTALRPQWPDGPPSNFEQVRFEHEIIQDFFWVADRCGLGLPEDSQVHRRELFSDTGNFKYVLRAEQDLLWPPSELWSLLGLAQHYGLRTRLLDWTLDARVAAYFAAREAAKWAIQPALAPPGVTHLAVWALSRTEVKVDALLSDLQDSVARRTGDRSKRRTPFLDWFALVTTPASSNENLRAQKGLFTVQLPPSMVQSDIADRRPLDHIIAEEGLNVKLTKFLLPIAKAPRLLRALAREGVSAAELFPGYDGVVRSLAERQLWRPRE